MRLTQRTSTWITVLALLGAPATAQTTRAISLRPAGAQANGDSGAYFYSNGDFAFLGASISNDGRYALFTSTASNLVPGDTNGKMDIFLQDTQTGDVTRVSVDANGAQSDGDSDYPSMSADGRYVVFASGADNLVPQDTNGHADIFLKDLSTGGITLVSVTSNGTQANGDNDVPVISGNGRYVVFLSMATNLAPVPNANGHLLVHDLQTGTTSVADVNSAGVVSAGSGISLWPSISADGRIVAFASDASDLVTGDTNGSPDAFVHDFQTGLTTRVGLHTSDAAVSANGRYVTYDSGGSFLHDLQTGTDTLVSIDFNGTELPGYGSTPSGDGRYVMFVVNTSLAASQVYLRDRATSSTYLLSIDTSHSFFGDGVSAEMFNVSSFSADDHRAVFLSHASNLVAGDTNNRFDVFVADLPNGAVTRVSVAGRDFPSNGDSNYPSASSDGRWAAFESESSDLVAGDTNGVGDVFVSNLQTGVVTRVSVSSAGVQGNGTSTSNSPNILSSDGRYVAFQSDATNLVTGDTNGATDVFVRDLQAATTTGASVSSGGLQGNGQSSTPAISADGRHVVFASDATNLVAGDTNNTTDIFVRDLVAGTTIRASVDSTGVQGNSYAQYPSILSDGRYVVFESLASNLVAGDTNGNWDIFLHDVQTGATTRVSVDSGGVQGNGDSRFPVISADGRIVAYYSDASNLVAGDTNNTTDIFVRDLQAGTTSRVSVDSAGGQSNSISYWPALSSDGRFVSFASFASNLVPGDTNGTGDVFRNDRLTGVTTLISISATGVQGDSLAEASSMPGDGRYVLFGSAASNLVPGDTNFGYDVFLRDRENEAVFEPFCFGDGTIVACPCGNSGSAGHGCQNSAGTGGAVLTGSGAPSLAADTVHLTSSGELPSVTSLLLQGTAVSAPTIFGDGRRCAGGTLKRLFSVSAVGGVATAPQGAQLSISARSAELGSPITAGSTRIYQMYYRDPSASFCPNPPGNLYNISSAVAVTWTN